nr:uncharacterized protein LOC124812099 [Hydra vulgaris]
MDVTRNHRRSWINKSFPSITEIVNQYPRLLDMPESILKEFQSNSFIETRLHIEWQKYKIKILEYAKSKPSLNTLMVFLTNELDEDKKSELAVECLVWLLPTPPQKSIKRARLLPNVVMTNLFFDFKDDTIDCEPKTLEDRGVKQPMLMRVSNGYYIKVDNTVITLPCCSCFMEALEFLFMTFYVFAVEYPTELRFFYGFLEKVMGLKLSVKSATVADLFTNITILPNI